MKKLNINYKAGYDEDRKDLISFLKKIQKRIPKAIKEVEDDTFGGSQSITPGLVGILIGTAQEDWYQNFFE